MVFPKGLTASAYNEFTNILWLMAGSECMVCVRKSMKDNLFLKISTSEYIRQ